MTDPAGVQAIEACVYTRFMGEDGEPVEIGYRVRVDTPAGAPVAVTIRTDPDARAVALDASDPAYANALAFADSLRRLALSVQFTPAPPAPRGGA